MAVTKARELDRYLSPAEVAARLCVRERQVRRWMDERRFEFVELPQGRRVKESVLTAWLESRRVGPDA